MIRLSFVVLWLFTLALPSYASDGAVTARQGMVVAQEARAARIGAEILATGGNAVDAAVATGFALAVTYPRAGNIGGGGFIVVPPAGQGGRPRGPTWGGAPTNHHPANAPPPPPRHRLLAISRQDDPPQTRPSPLPIAGT